MAPHICELLWEVGLRQGLAACVVGDILTQVVRAKLRISQLFAQVSDVLLHTETLMREP